MVELAIGTAIASLKAAGDLAGGFLKLRDMAQVQGRVIELQSLILAAQQSALAAQGEQFALLEEKRALEKHVADLEAWEREKERYQLQEVGRGSFAYTLRPEARGSEPPHMLCPNCYQQGRKSLLQATDVLMQRQRVHRCPACAAEVAGAAQPLEPLPARNNPGIV